MAESEEESSGQERKKGGKAEYIDPPHTIRNKVTGGGPISGKMLQQAENVIQQHSERYIDRAQQQVEELVDTMRRAQSNDDDETRVLENIFQQSHDIRGLGSTFGYSLVTEIAASLCNFVESLDSYDDGVVEVLNAHVDALRGMIGNDIQGDGGQIGQEIIAGLAQAVSKHSPPPAEELEQ